MKKSIVITIIFLVVIAAFLAGGQIFKVACVNVVFDNRTGLTTENEIVSIVGLDKRNNIFSVNEREIKEKVSKVFADHSIYVTDVERSFPNVVTIYVKERTPIFLLKVYSPTGLERYVPTDKDFQRGTVYNAGDIALDLKLITVEGIEVKDSFDEPEFYTLRTVASALTDERFEEAALPYFFDKVVFDEQKKATFYVSGTGATFVVGTNVDKASVVDLLHSYLALPEAERFGKTFEA